MIMDIETLNKANQINAEINRLREHLAKLDGFVDVHGKQPFITISDGDRYSMELYPLYAARINFIENYTISIEAEIKRLEEDFEDLQPKPLLKVQPDKRSLELRNPQKANRYNWLERNHFIISDGTHTSADGKVQSNDGDFIIKIGGELIIVSPELLNDFEEFTDAYGNVHTRWSAMVDRFHAAVKKSKENEDNFFNNL